MSNLERATLDVDDRSVYAEGDLLYEAMLVDLQAATRSIRFESYIFASDGIGALFVAALLAAAKRGVSVALRADHAGSFFTLSNTDIGRLREHGVDFHWSRRWSPRRPLVFNQRNHRKLLIVDEQVAYLGGFNIHAPSSLRLYGPPRWRDTHLRFVGPLAADAATIFDACSETVHEPVGIPPELGMTRLIPNSSPRCRQVWRCALHDALQEARARVWVTTPYFVPDRRLQGQLRAAAALGIDVRLLVPGKSDVPIARWAAHAAYAQLLGCGVRIFEYLPRVLHAKTMLVDDRWAAIGTANMDYRSLFVNDEINFVDREGGLNCALSEMFTTDLAESREIRDVRWRGRPSSALITETIGWMMRRWL